MRRFRAAFSLILPPLSTSLVMGTKATGAICSTSKSPFFLMTYVNI